jgi:hypothetical protein
MAIKYIKGINHHIAYKTDHNSYLEDVGKWRGRERGMKIKVLTAALQGNAKQPLVNPRNIRSPPQ